MIPVQLSTTARADLESIYEWIAQDKPKAARSWVDMLTLACAGLATFPYSGRPCPDVDLHVLVRGGYAIYYRVQPERVLILRVIHGAKQAEMSFEKRD